MQQAKSNVLEAAMGRSQKIFSVLFWYDFTLHVHFTEQFRWFYQDQIKIVARTIGRDTTGGWIYVNYLCAFLDYILHFLVE
jgi:tryptophan 2,3-dioxygenase